MFRNFFYTSASRGLSTLFNFLIAIGIARVLGTNGKGESTLIVTIISVIVFAAELAAGNALVQKLPTHKLRNFLFPAFIWTAIVSLIAFFGIKYYMHYSTQNALIIACTALFNVMFNLNRTEFHARQNFKSWSFYGVLQIVIVLLSLSAYFYVFDMKTIEAYIYSLWISFVLTAFFTTFSIKEEYLKMQFKIDLKTYWSSVKNSLLFQFSELMLLLLLRTGFFVLYELKGSSSLGIYSVGVSIVEMVWIISRSFATIDYSKVANEGMNENIHRQIMFHLRFSLWTSTLILILLYCIPNTVYVFFFGQGFMDIKYYIRWLIPGIVVFNSYFILASFFAGLSKNRINVLVSFIGTIVLILSAYLFIPKYEMTGTGFASSIAFVISTLLMYFFYYSYNPFKLKELLFNGKDVESIKRKIANFNLLSPKNDDRN